jgi:hypothetical protein
MSQQTRAIFLFLTIVAVMLVSAVGTTSVYADDGTPPPSPTEAVEVDPSTGGETEPAPTEPAVEPPAGEGEPVATEPAVTEPLEEAAPTEAPVVEAAPVVEEQQPAETDSAASILEQVPDNTTVTVLNAEGEAQPLTTQESAEAILVSDPIWCPIIGGVQTAPGGDGCTDEFDSFTALLSFLDDNEGLPGYTSAGTIYVEMNEYLGGESSIDFNAYDFETLNGFDLIVQGGWNKDDDSTDGTTNFDIPIIIGSSTNPWAGSLTINNINIDGVSNQTGLTLFSLGNITLSSVTVTNSQAGASLVADGKVDIKNSKFNNNTSHKVDGFGLQIDNKNTVSLVSVEANGNETFGADIKSTGSVAIANSFFNGNVSYTNCDYGKSAVKNCYDCKEVPNGGYGLKVVTTDYAFLNGVEANENYLFGANIQAAGTAPLNGTYIWNSNFNENGSGSLNNPTGYGLKVVSDGPVSIISVHADKNQLFGANIQAADGESVTINDSFFDGNKSYYNSCTSPKGSKPCEDYDCDITYYGYGLHVVATGTTLVSNVSASNNYLYGAHLEGSYVAVSGTVNSDGTVSSTFSNNGSGASGASATGKGLEIISTGGVSLAGVQASNNQVFGAKIVAVDFVNIENGFFNGNKYSYKGVNDGYGLDVFTEGGIVMTGVEANDNYLFGAHLVGSSVQISGFAPKDGGADSSFKRNKEGLKIESQGLVLLNAVNASNNKIAGATIAAGGNVSINNSFFSGNFSYTSSCKGKTYNGYGLNVVSSGVGSNGVVSLNNVDADNNYLYGAYLKGSQVFVYGSLNPDGTTNFSSFSNNGTPNRSDHIGKGLEVVSTNEDVSKHSVTLSLVAADNNQLFGANVKAKGYVSITNSTFSGNHSYYTSCSKSSSYSSGKSSGYSSGKTCGGQECTKVYDGYGIEVMTTGDIYMGDVVANENYLFGAKLTGANVTIEDSVFSFNASPTEKGKTPTGRGLEVKSTGNTSLQGVEANNNQLFGATIDADGQVNILDSMFSNNSYYTYSSCKTKSAGYGLKVISRATVLDPEFAEKGITLNDVVASGNGAEGAILDGASTVGVTNGEFNNNGASGLVVTADAEVTLTDILADGNKGSGVEVTGVCTNTVHVYDGQFSNNSKYGLKVVDATYTPHGIQTFANNGSGNVFQDSSTCVSDDDDDEDVSGNPGSGNNGGQHGWNGYWWWYWQHGSGRHHR